MNTIYGDLAQSQKDLILIFEVGFATQTINEQYRTGLTSMRLNKAVSSLLRHWDLLATMHPDFATLTRWGLKHSPYRYGEVVYSTHRVGSFGGERATVAFIDDIIKGSTALRSLGVRHVKESNLGYGRYNFPAPRIADYASIIDHVDLSGIDMTLLRNLSVLYSKPNTEDLAAISTCYTEEDCYRAALVEVSMWAHDISNSLDLIPLKPVSPGDLSRLERLLVQAFQSDREIQVKAQWYRSLPRIMSTIKTIGIGLGLQEDVISILVSHAGDGHISERIATVVDASELMTGFIGFELEVLQGIGLPISIPEHISLISTKFSQKLAEIDIGREHVLDILESTPKGSLKRISAAKSVLSRSFSNLKEHLKSLDVPIDLIPKDLFPPAGWNPVANDLSSGSKRG